MDYLGDKLSVAQTQVSGWVGMVRRFVSSAVERGGSRGEDASGEFKRTNSLRSLASRSRESFRRFSLRSQQRLSLRRRPTAPSTPTAVRPSPVEARATPPDCSPSPAPKPPQCSPPPVPTL